ncbi:DALR anticodon-binding domain-containing protein [Streptomonospora wellingtoniae]|uniref:DALR anticodon-binding domain-containing protein n=1 Tax=Streptomonospora wellingtoniae TaxID=3075544 RepID=A0ABU2KR11_9ACTN|nr:DALR anticodon-binding domain-containing protein [Streptomonospora sp. DSM 45055]MDT0301709.1 DALR anticodon-binding domain-containing protein [Streptomonospora sp. DSM 45055]
MAADRPDAQGMWWRPDGAAPWRVDALLRGAVARAAECPPEDVPIAEPRRAAPPGHSRCTSALPLRAARPLGLNAVRLAAQAAERLRDCPGVADAGVERGGFVTLDADPEARAAMVRAAAADGDRFLRGYLHYLEGIGRLGDPPGRHGEGAPAPSAAVPVPAAEGERSASAPLDEASSVEDLRRLARADALLRMNAAVGTGSESSVGTAPEPGGEGAAGAPPREVSWRDPRLDGGHGTTPAARLLATVGEASARVAFCRSAAARPRPSEETGPGLPAVPTAERPGAWVLGTAANPAFAVRYAHAHAASTLRWAREAHEARAARTPEGCACSEPAGEHVDAVLAAALEPPAAAELAGALYDGPLVLHAARRRSEPHMLVRYLEGLAAAYHGWRGSCGGLIVGAAGGPAGREPASAFGRLRLCAAAAEVLRAGLSLLGVSAPTRL